MIGRVYGLLRSWAMLVKNHPSSRFAPDWLYRPALGIIHRLHQAGFEAYIAGGAVRDHLLGRIQNDIDIATSATPTECEALFSRTVPVGASFGVMIVMQGNLAFEVATFRSEDGYQDGRHPSTVKFCSAREDVSRRDFTINGIFWDTQTNSPLDWVGGKADIQAKLIRCIGTAKARFSEDHLRMLRAIRFAAQLGFEVEPKTLAAISELACHIRDVSMERVRIEIEKLLQSDFRSLGLALLESTGLGEVIWKRLFSDSPKEWAKKPGPLQMAYEKVPPLMPHFLCTLDFKGRRNDFPALSWWILLLDLALAGSGTASWTDVMPHSATTSESPSSINRKQAKILIQSLWTDTGPLRAGVQQLGRALRFSREELFLLKQGHEAFQSLFNLDTQPLANQLRLVRHSGLRLALDLHAILNPDMASKDRSLLQSLRSKHADRLSQKPFLTGRDLLAAGVLPGPQVGKTLLLLEDEQLEGRIVSRNSAEIWLANFLSSQ